MVRLQLEKMAAVSTYIRGHTHWFRQAVREGRWKERGMRNPTAFWGSYEVKLLRNFNSLGPEQSGPGLRFSESARTPSGLSALGGTDSRFPSARL